jgi:hypothetical protein
VPLQPVGQQAATLAAAAAGSVVSSSTVEDPLAEPLRTTYLSGLGTSTNAGTTRCRSTARLLDALNRSKLWLAEHALLPLRALPSEAARPVVSGPNGSHRPRSELRLPVPLHVELTVHTDILRDRIAPRGLLHGQAPKIIRYKSGTRSFRNGRQMMSGVERL